MQEEKNKILLIAGCSHAAGFEIDGSTDSEFNRQHSFGNVLAHKLGRTPVNIALGALSNNAIARTVINWITTQYDPSSMDVQVLVAWTESSRIDFPYSDRMDYKSANTCASFYTEITDYFLQINAGWPGINEKEKQVISYWQDFQSRHDIVCQLNSINTALQIQYFLKMHNINYCMCNTMFMAADTSKHLQFYLKLIDQRNYIDLLDNDKAFYWYYKNQGHNNPKAKYWHHGEVPHKLYAEKLYEFIIANK
jgi:hypothetical protein